MKRRRTRAVGSGSPLSRERAIDLYFIEHRGKVLDLAAFLDRVDRSSSGKNGGSTEDVRMVALREAIAVLDDGRDDRARRILELLSDPSTEPIPTAGTKGAAGVHLTAPLRRGRRKGARR